MSAVSAQAPQQLASLRQQASRFWRSRLPRERQLSTIALLAVALFLGWSTLLAPAWQTVRSAPQQLDRLDTQLQQMQSAAAEVQALRAVPPISPPQAAIALKAATDRLGDKGRLSLQGERAVLTLSGVGPEALRAWLNEARSGARARPVEVQLLRAAQGYSGTIAVNLGGTP